MVGAHAHICDQIVMDFSCEVFSVFCLSLSFQGLPGPQGANGFPGPKGPPVKQVFLLFLSHRLKWFKV